MTIAAAVLGIVLAAEPAGVAAEPPGGVASPAAGSSLVGAPPVAPPSPVELRWDAPAGCPDAAAVQEAIARGLPPSSTGTGVAGVRADVVVTALDAEHWRAALDLRGADWTATRTLKGPTCAAVADAASLVIDLALATELQQREVVIAPPPPPPPPPPPEPPPSSPTLALAAAIDTGALPSPTAGGAVALGWRTPRFRVDLRGTWFASQRGTVAGRPDTGATLSLASALLRGCRLWGGGALSLGPCVGGGVDRVHGAGFGPIKAAQATNVAPFVDAGLQAEGRMSRWVVAFLAAEAAIPLVRARFSVKDSGLVHEADAVSLRVAAGLEFRFR